MNIQDNEDDNYEDDLDNFEKKIKNKGKKK